MVYPMHILVHPRVHRAHLLKSAGVQDPGFGVQSGLILSFFWIWIGLDIVSNSTGSGFGLSK